MGFLPRKKIIKTGKTATIVETPSKKVRKVIEEEPEEEEEEYDEEEEEEIEEEEVKPVVKKEETSQKSKIVVVKELPVQPIREFTDEEGTIIHFKTIEEALSEIMNSEGE